MARSAQYLAALHNPRADPKMVNSKDVTPSKTVVNILTKGEGDMTVRRPESDRALSRFLSEHVAGFELAEPLNADCLGLRGE